VSTSLDLPTPLNPTTHTKTWDGGTLRIESRFLSAVDVANRMLAIVDGDIREFAWNVKFISE
jgi:hypothetical protein